MEISTSGFKKNPAFFSLAMKNTPCGSDNIQADGVKQGLTQKFQIGQQVFDKYRAMCYGDTQLPPAIVGSFWNSEKVNVGCRLLHCH